MKMELFKINLAFVVVVLFVGMNIFSSAGVNVKNHALLYDGEACSAAITLPPPDFTGRNLELSICRRMSVREFDDSDVSDQELSNILWAAYGYTSDGERTIHSVNGRFAIVIYVIRRDNTYKYVPETHSLSLFREGDYTHIGMFDDAPIKIGLVWDKRVSSDERMAMAEIGMIGQNVYFEANALDLGTVTTASYANELNKLLLPFYEKAFIVMPLGRPLHLYDFTYDPLPPSDLPSVVNNSISLEDAINNRHEATIWNDEPLTTLEQSQIIWASYGYSYLIDNLNDKRHRTLPSSMGTYPLHVFAVNHTGVYRYYPSSHSIVETAQGDRRMDISEAVESDDVMVSSAPWILISFLDTTIGNPDYWRVWYYEAGAIAHNVFLESTALDLSANVVNSIVDEDAVRSALGISSQTNLIPLLIMPSGRTTPSNPPDTPDISGPTSGKPGTEYTYIAVTTDPDRNQVSYWFDWGDGTNSGWTAFVDSGVEVTASHSWTLGEYTIKVKARDIHGTESNWGTLEVTMPKNKVINTPLFLQFLLNFLQNHPILYQLLQLFLRL